MMIMFSFLLLISTSLVLMFLRFTNPKFRFSWLIALGGAALAFVSVILWQIKLPLSISIPFSPESRVLSNTLSWFADDRSWLYAISLVTLSLAAITTAIVRKNTDPMNWVGILVLVSFGLLSISADNPFTLAVAWIVIDIIEVILLLGMINSEDIERIIVTFTIRLIGIFLLLWASVLSHSSGLPLTFQEIPPNISLILILAIGIRIGFFNIHLPTRVPDQKRGVITTLLLVSTASSLFVLSRFQANTFPQVYVPYLTIITGIISVYGGLRWLFARDELNGRPNWILCLGFLSITAAITGNNLGSIALGSSLILIGGLIFLYSARGVHYTWIHILGIWVLSAFPFSLTSGTWLHFTLGMTIFLIPQLLGQSLLLAGFYRHTFDRSKDVFLGSEPRWLQLIYPIGLTILPVTGLIIGLWGWDGARRIGNWQISIVVMVLSILFYLVKEKIHFSKRISSKSKIVINLSIPSKFFWWTYYSIRQVINLITFTLEGDGGILWSIVLLVLFISLITKVNL